MKRTICLAVSAILAAVAIDSQAEEMGRIVVTASRTAQTEDETLASISVITRQDLERLQARSLQDALRGVAGLSFTNNGGSGKATSLHLRGTEADHVLVLVDGIKLGSATTGAAALQDLPIGQIERIEIVRGPRSSLYGSEAIGGVIQIFTRRGGGDLKGSFSLGLGSHVTRETSLGLSGGGERGWYSANLAFNDTDGIDACRGGPGVGCKVIDPDADGYRNGSGSLRGGYRFGNGLEVDLHALRAKGKNEFDGSFVDESESRQQVLGGSLRYAPADSWLLTLSGGQSRDDSDNYRNGLFRTKYNTRRDSLSLQGDVELGSERLLTFGFDYQDDQVDSTALYEVDSRDNRGLFVQFQGGFSVLDLQLSLRQDDNQAFGRHTTGGIAWGYGLGFGLRLRTSYATAFKTPTFNELYYPEFGNPDLRPEESASLELGLEGGAEWGTWSLSAFQTRIDEMIAFDAHRDPANIDRARISGLEALLSAGLGPWQSSASLTLLDPRNRSDGDTNGNLLRHRPRRSLRVDLDRDFGTYALGLTLLAEGRRYNDLANIQELGGFSTLDLRASYRINRAWRLQGRCENLFDKKYETVTYFNQPGRSFYLTLSYQS